MRLESFPELVNYCRKLTSETLYTGAQIKPFTVVVEGSTLWFIRELVAHVVKQILKKPNWFYRN